MKVKLLFVFSFLTVLFLSGNINAQSMTFSTGVGSDCAATNLGSSFAITAPDTSVLVYAIVNLTTDTPEATSVKFEIYKDGGYEFSSTIDLPAKTNCYYIDLLLFKPGAWTVKAVDASGNLVAEGTVNITQ
jgi:hypothetical protein